MLSPWRRPFVVAICLSLWLILLLTGWSLGGAVHLLLVAALALFPWSALKTPPPPGADHPR